ncbi:hypothetical protein [Pseudoalteromonas sp. S16_S37]|uniref:hypothetical protein n=1 Tax=Pseudoalteromonas sp. S16_S37 TaxID=2720228 RepID=UPI00167FF435|nr:hypothetical protein [Pseudoalteromonas sp. S16_S37]MBD1584262.1 hypothetical protein [Pseudoalteromonas sp. S16_S37]
MKKHALSLSLFSILASTHTLAIAHDLENAGQVKKFINNALNIPVIAKQTKRFAGEAIQSETVEAITPRCPTLSTGNLYTLSDSNAGDNICYHFEITERSKTTALLVGQSQGTNVNLSIIKHNPDNTFTAIGSSANPDNQDEVVLALTEPGHYYWFMEVIESDGAAYNFGAAVANNLDSYEFNDTVALSTVLPDRQNSIVGNMDSINDVDYYQFTAVRGQDLSLSFFDGLSDEYVIEIYNSGWVPITPNTYQIISNLQENQSINLRVSANKALPANPENSYTLNIASIVASFSNHVITGENNVNRIPYSARNYSGPYLTTQAYRQLNWSLVLKDTTGAPIEGAVAQFTFIKNVTDAQNTLTTYKVNSDSNGAISEQISLSACNPNVTGIEHTEYSFGYKNEWRSDVEVGLWRIDIPTNRGVDEEGRLDTIGIGGDNVPYVYFGHICDQDLISSNPS